MSGAGNYITTIKADVGSGLNDPAISERVFLTLPPAALMGDLQLAYRIRKLTAKRLAVAITQVQFCGSAALGMSPHKGTTFSPNTSDIDLAIIDARWFSRMLEAAQSVTRGYTDLTRFPVRDGKTPETFTTYVANKGMIRLDLMPSCEVKSEWVAAFSEISQTFSLAALSISGAVYLSENFFISKQCTGLHPVRMTLG